RRELPSSQFGGHLTSFHGSHTEFHPVDPGSGKPTAKSCEADLKKRTYDQIAMADMKAGGWACALTVEGNLVGIQIRSIPPIGDEKAPLPLFYTVWQR
ncbi:hypothetical protein ACGFJC_53410, partial [Nonomuraea fuscirosea]